MENDSLNSRFVRTFKKLDHLKENNPDLYQRFEDRYEILKSFRNMRNVLCHVDNPGEVSQEFYDQLEAMVKKMTTRIDSLSIKLNQLYCASTNTKLMDVLNRMNSSNYSFVPILDERKHLLGVISEKSILTILGNHQEFLYRDSTIIKYLDYFSIDKNPNYYYSFVKRLDLAIDVKSSFSVVKNGKRCGLAFVTETGKHNEAILGLVNAWDLLKI